MVDVLLPFIGRFGQLDFHPPIFKEVDFTENAVAFLREAVEEYAEVRDAGVDLVLCHTYTLRQEQGKVNIFLAS